jgi:protein TonB
MHGRADILEERESWRNPLAVSAALHVALFGGMVLYGFVLGRAGDSWGGSEGGDGAMSATLVSSVPLPAPQVKTENILANESKGLSQTLPKPKEVEKEPDAIPIPDKTSKRKPEPKQQASVQPPKRQVEPLPEPANVVPFGQGGPVSGPYGSFNTANAKGGFGFTGSGGGDFGSRFSWYVDAVRRKVSDNWLKYEVDPSIHDAKRVFITFDITRTGQPANVQLSTTSGVPSLDISAVRAIQRIDTFGPLPGDYPGSKVSVEFWFDYRR